MLAATTPSPTATVYSTAAATIVAYSPSDQLAWLDLNKFESCKLVPYLDTKMHWTVGIGHLIRDFEHDSMFPSITLDRCHQLFEADWLTAVHLSQQLAYYMSLNDARKRVQACLMFNMGPIKWAEFHDTQRFLATGAFAAAGAALLDSEWATEVHKDTHQSRGQTYARIVVSGVWE